MRTWKLANPQHTHNHSRSLLFNLKCYMNTQYTSHNNIIFIRTERELEGSRMQLIFRQFRQWVYINSWNPRHPAELVSLSPAKWRTRKHKRKRGISCPWFHTASEVSCCSVVSNSVTPWTTARQASLSFTSQSLLKLMSVESVTSSNHLILYHPLLFLPSIFPSTRVFSKWSEMGMQTDLSLSHRLLELQGAWVWTLT